MKKLIIKIAIIVTVFILSLMAFEMLLNRATTQTTEKMKSATLPVVYFKVDDISFNPLFGYVHDMDIAYMRSCITPLLEGRLINITVDKCGHTVSAVEYELRTVDGEHLIENGKATEIIVDDETLNFSLAFKDLIEYKKEYSLRLVLSLDNGQKVNYYTTVISDDDCKLYDKLAFVKDFNKKTFEKDESIATYLESDGTGDDTNYNHVGIHSSFDQITWGNLPMEQVSIPNAYITDIGESTARIDIRYYACMRTETAVSRYNVTETYRLRQGSERFYLLDFDRNTSRIFFPEDEGVAEDKIYLGITNNNIDLKESDDGNVLAFVSEGSLYVVNIAGNRLARAFSFFDDDNADIRARHMDYDIKVLNIDETGNVLFAVSGYINRGEHEGEVGLMVMGYNGLYNNISEISFVPYHGSHELLQAGLNKVLKYSPENQKIYLCLAEDLYELDIETNEYELIVDNTSELDIKASKSQGMVAWQNSIDENTASVISLMNLETGKIKEIKAGDDEYIKAVGFMDEDLVYGLAKRGDVHKNKYLETVFPMYELNIMSSEGANLKKYAKEGFYVTQCVLDGSMITMGRMKQSEGGFVDTSPDTIISEENIASTKNKVEVIAIDTYKKILTITLKKALNEKNLKISDPDMVIYEESKLVDIPVNEQTGVYWVYEGESIAGKYRKAAQAVSQAYDISGIVVDDSGRVVYKRGNVLQKNQIMAITGKKKSDDESETITCIEAALEHAGYPRKIGSLLDQGKTIEEIYENTIPKVRSLNLTGCDINTLMYYLDKDIPVLGISNSKAILLVGYNEKNLVWMNPEDGTVYKVGLNDSREFFESGGNRFYTYMYIE